MTKKDKLFMRFLENPNSFRFSKIEKVLKRIGFAKISVRGSHYKFRHKETKFILIIPVHSGDCLPKYKIELKRFFIENKITQNEKII